jgi:nitroimidazol reductase NimA-like FMN-containing flavoprotein (pyridoxamine 5'-phosphate oxidase superfamily)
MTVDELGEYGLVRMDEAAIDEFLEAESTGVLGLPTEGAPYLLPLSFVREGDSLYFSYLQGGSSRKAALTDGAERAAFLVYRVDTQFSWQSVLLEGPVRQVPESAWPEFEEHPRNAW